MRFLVSILEGFLLSILIVWFAGKIPFHPGAEFAGIFYIAILYITITIIMVFSIVHGIFRQLDKEAKNIELGDKIFLGVALLLAILLTLLNLNNIMENVGYIIKNKSFI